MVIEDTSLYEQSDIFADQNVMHLRVSSERRRIFLTFLSYRFF